MVVLSSVTRENKEPDVLMSTSWSQSGITEDTKPEPESTEEQWQYGYDLETVEFLCDIAKSQPY